MAWWSTVCPEGPLSLSRKRLYSRVTFIFCLTGSGFKPGCARLLTASHDVSPGSRIIWNTVFLAVFNVYKEKGEQGVRRLLTVQDKVVSTPEGELDE
jgi:hypothetical protein